MKELLFSITKKDFKLEFYKSSGPGGQNKNKRDTACRCTHIKSGAVGVASDEREQLKNKKLAFQRCINSEKFKKWHELECIKAMMAKNTEKEMLENIDRELNNPDKTIVEIKDENGKWIKE